MREDTGASATVTIAKRLINKAHHDLYVGHGEKFSWAERRAFLTTHPEYTTGTLTATVGSTTITGDSTAWNTANDYGQNNIRTTGKIVIAGRSEVYNTTAVASDTSVTIDPAYIGSTDSSLTYRYFEDEYDLASDFLKPVDQRSFDDASRIKLIGRSDFRKWFPRNSTTTNTIVCATIQDYPPSGDTTPIRRIRFGPAPSNAQVIPYSYVTSNIVVQSDGTAAGTLSNDTDEPTMPLHYRHVIVLGAMAQWYLDRKDDSQRAQLRQAEYLDLRGRMIGDQDLGAQRFRIQFRGGLYRANARRPLRGSSRRYDTTGEFKRLEDRY